MHYIYQNRISFIQFSNTSGKVLTYMYIYICKSYVYLPICDSHRRSNILYNIIQIKCENIMIIFIRALYNQNTYLYMCAYICYLKVFTSSPYTLTAISVYHSLINTFLPVIPRNDSEILISVNSEQDVPMSIVSS